MDHLETVRSVTQASVGGNSAARGKAVPESGKNVQETQGQDLPAGLVGQDGHPGLSGSCRVKGPCNRALDEPAGAGLAGGGGQRGGPVLVA